MKFSVTLFPLFILLTIAISAQTGCPSNLSTTVISGPDSLHTDADQTFRSLTINPLNPDHVIVGTEGNGIFISRDGGQNWTWSRNGLRHLTNAEYAETWYAVFDPVDTSKIFIATTNSAGPPTGNYPTAEAGVYFSEDGGSLWNQRNCGLTNSKASAIWCDPTNANNLLLAIEGGEPSFTSPPMSYYKGGIYRSTDGGLNWSITTIPVGADSSSFWRFEQHGNTIITYGLHFENGNGEKSIGFIKSTDGGQSWQLLPEPLAHNIIAEFAVSHDGVKIIAAVRDSFFVYTSDNSGTSWNKINLPVNGVIKYHPENDSIVFFSGWEKLYKSRTGISSANINSPAYKLVGSFTNYIEDIEFAPSNPSIIYLTTRGYHVYKSEDGGENFQEIARLRDVMRGNTTGVDEITTGNKTQSNDAQVYPNPVRYYLNLRSSLLRNSSATITIWDILGRKVMERRITSDNYTNNYRLPVSSLSVGIYILQIRNSIKTMQVKFIKQ